MPRFARSSASEHAPRTLSPASLATLASLTAVALLASCRNDENPDSPAEPTPAGSAPETRGGTATSPDAALARTNAGKGHDSTPTTNMVPTATPTDEPAPDSTLEPAPAAVPTEAEIDPAAAANATALRATLASRAEKRERPAGVLVVEGMLVLDEHAAGIPQPCFDRYLRAAFATEESAAALRAAGVAVHFEPDGTVLATFRSDATLAFSTLACDAVALRLTAPGKRVTIVTGDASKSTVVTSGGANAGDVVLILGAGGAPGVEANGSAGAKGADAPCPASFPGCLVEGGARQPAASAGVETFQARTEDRFVPVGAAIPGTGTTYLSKLGTNVPGRTGKPHLPSSVTREDYCKNDVRAVGNGKVDWRGDLRVESRITSARWGGASRLDGADGFGIPPSDGAQGAAGGIVRAHFITAKDGWKESVSTQGGAGGSAGRGGLVAGGAGRAPQTVPETVEEIVHGHTASATVTYEYEITSYEWLGGGGMCSKFVATTTTDERLPVGLRVPSAAARVFQGGSVTLPGGSEGRTPERPSARAGVKGADGVVEGSVAQSVEAFLAHVPTEVALPRALVDDVEAAWRNGGLVFRAAATR